MVPAVYDAEFTEFSPDTIVADLAIAGFRWRGSQARRVRILPDACDYLFSDSDGTLTLLGGNRRAFQEMELPAGEVHGYKLYPGSAAALFGLDARDLPAGTPVHVTDLNLSKTTVGMIRRLDSHGDNGRIPDLALRSLLPRLSSSPQWEHQRLLRYFVSRIGDSGSLTDLAGECGSSLRTLERRCRSACGLSPSDLRSVARFFSAYRLLRRGEQHDGRLRLTDIAYAAGYADQAHFIRDFQRFGGMRPGDALRRPQTYALTLDDRGAGTT